jgi:hypothetical protein
MSDKCAGLTLKNTQCKLKAIKGCKWCKKHQSLYKLEKPDECPICYDELKTERPLKCGHWCCDKCIKNYQQSLEIDQDLCCPTCRSVLKKARLSKKDIFVEFSIHSNHTSDDEPLFGLEITHDDTVNEEDIERMSQSMVQWFISNFVQPRSISDRVYNPSVPGV